MVAAAGEIDYRADAATPIYWIEALQFVLSTKIYAEREADEKVERTLLEKLIVDRQLLNCSKMNGPAGRWRCRQRRSIDDAADRSRLLTCRRLFN